MSGQTWSAEPITFDVAYNLQWRAGQLSGQTAERRRPCRHHISLQWRAGQLSGQTGGGRRSGPVRRVPSMEGRTIVRPDMRWIRAVRSWFPSFNGGPDNCPARQASPSTVAKHPNHLQWRAGQLSGQTRSAGGLRRLGDLPSMEGRTIVRPDQSGQAG